MLRQRRGLSGLAVVDRLLPTRELVALAGGVAAGRLVPDLAGGGSAAAPKLSPWRRHRSRIAILTGNGRDVTGSRRHLVAEATPGASSPAPTGLRQPGHRRSQRRLLPGQGAGPNPALSRIFRPTRSATSRSSGAGRTAMPVALCIGHHPAYDLSRGGQLAPPGLLRARDDGEPARASPSS